jgi:hypothetical protein
MTIPQVTGWRSSAYGDQDPTAVTQGNKSYYVEAAKGMALKFPGSSPGCLYTVGYIGTTETDMPIQLKNTLGTMKGVSYASDNPDPEIMLTAFDAAGLNVILGLEPGNADTAVLATKILGKYKNHPCIKGMGMDVEWYMYAGSGDTGKVTLPLSVATAFKNAILAVNPNYKVVIKHFDASKLPKGMSGVTYLTDTCGFTKYSEAISTYVDWANSFPGSEVAYQLGYDAMECGEDPNWWLNLAPKPGYGEAARQIFNSISSSISNPIYSVYWADFTILTQFPIDYVAPVDNPILTSISVLPTTASINVNTAQAPSGNTQQLKSTCKDQNGNIMTCPILTWSTNSPSVATVDSSGLVTGISTGTANITASTGGKISNISTITVITAPTGSKFNVYQLGQDGVTVVKSVNGSQTVDQASLTVANILKTL